MTLKDAPQADAVTLLQTHGDAVNTFFQSLKSRNIDAPARLVESIEYSLMAGGKRLRPALVLETFAAIASRKSQAEIHTALAAAAAMELIHTFSLVHDDLPAMDNDDLRRGRPTNHKVYGEAMAILAGDAMTTLAFEILAGDAAPQVAAALVKELAHASGPQGMIGGQVLDMEGENKSLTISLLQRLHSLKTGALLTASCRMGAIAAGASDDQLQAVTRFGRHLGLAFQIIDDVLDVTSTPEQMGKATNKDAKKGKNTYPTLLGLDGAKAEARKALDAALNDLSILGNAADGLRSIAKFVVERQH